MVIAVFETTTSFIVGFPVLFHHQLSAKQAIREGFVFVGEAEAAAEIECGVVGRQGRGLQRGPQRGEAWTVGTKEMLDDMHKRKPDMADEIFVINAGRMH